MTNINARIKELRKNKKLTQTEFSSLANTSQSYLSEVENEKGKATVDMIIGIAIAFKDISLRWLLTGENIEENQRTSIDENVLKEVIEVVEWALDQVNANPDPKKKAELIVAVYDFYIDEGVPEDRSKLVKLVKAVA